jgi:hypothetical protein
MPVTDRRTDAIAKNLSTHLAPKRPARVIVKTISLNVNVRILPANGHRYAITMPPSNHGTVTFRPITQGYTDTSTGFLVTNTSGTLTLTVDDVGDLVTQEWEVFLAGFDLTDEVMVIEVLDG